MSKYIFGKKELPMGRKTYIMGILNVTPDSFSDGGRFLSPDKALAGALEMLEDGADIIDVGAVSTRPFSEKISDEEEWDRLFPVLKALRKSFSVPISVDTFNPLNIKRSLDSGADIINDVGGVFLSETAQLIKEYNAGWVIMHGGVRLADAGASVCYKNGIIDDVNSFFEDMLNKMRENNVPIDNICLDPGFGFSKDPLQNIELLRRLDEIKKGELPLLCALSRKRFIGELSGEKIAEKRDIPTLGANLAAVARGADILRVHNVSLHKQALNTADCILRKNDF